MADQNTNTDNITKEDKNYRSLSYIEEEAKEGILFSTWTREWGLKVYPWYGMDRIRFSFIEKGKKGKGNSFNVSINTIKHGFFDFETLKHEVLHDIRTPYDFLTVLAQEKKDGQKYPKRYSFRTGSTGEKKIGFCNSSSNSGEFCINAQTKIDGKSVYVNIPVSYYDIYNIVKAYDETYEQRREELKKIREEGNKALSFNKDEVEEPEEEKMGSEINQGEEKQETPAADKPAGIHVRTVSKITKLDTGDYVFEAIKDDDTIINIRVPKEIADDMNKEKSLLFDRFINKVSSQGADFNFTGSKRKTKDGLEYIFAAFC